MAKKKMRSRKALEDKNPFTDLLNSLKEGKLSHNHVQIAYRAAIREGDYFPEAVKNLLAGGENKSGILFSMFTGIKAVVGAVELAYRRGVDVGYDKGYKDGEKVASKKKRKKKCQKRKQQ